MRTPLLVTGLAIAVCATLGAQSFPSQLQVSDTEARQQLVDMLPGTGLPLGAAAGRAFVALPAAARVAVVNASITWMKAYVNSAAFKAAYTKAREQAKPTADNAGAIDEELKRRQDEQMKQLADARAALAMVPAAQRAEVEQTLKQSEALLKDPNNVKALREQIVQERKDDAAALEADLKEWQERYPANPLVLVARRLQLFLDASADVDFSAKLVKVGDRMRFENPDYEAKSPEWKMCFRAGREAVAAARAAAAAWLKELPGR